MFRVIANNAEMSLPQDYFTFFTHFSNTGAYLHIFAKR